jgi:putative addiction module component (TIGR02574 family)
MSSLEDVFAAAGKLTPQERLRLIGRLWETLPADCWPAGSETETADVKRRLAKYDLQQLETVPWPIVERLVADCAKSTGSKVYAAPRRFDLATIFIVTVAYSLLFAGMSVVQFPPGVSLAVAGFITLVGTGQALLFGGNRPRTASLLVGTALYSLSMLVYWLVMGRRAYPPSVFLVAGTYVLIGGAMLGYLAGVMVGGVFFLADMLRRAPRLRKRQEDARIQDEP